MKRSSPELRPTRWDALIVLSVLLLAALIGLRPIFAEERGGELTVVVSIDGEEVERMALDRFSAEAHRYTSRGYTLCVEASDGKVTVTQSDCPNQDCVHSGAISRAGQSIVCLPARIAVTLSGAASDYDVIAG